MNIIRFLMRATALAVVLVQWPAVSAGEAGASIGVLDADELVAGVLQVNRGLAALEAAVREAAARQDGSGRLDDPELAWDTAPRTSFSRPRHGQNIRVSQRIPWPGMLGHRQDQARHQRSAQVHRLDAARLEVEVLTRTAWAEWFFVHQALDLNEENQAVLEELRSSVHTRYAAGQARQQDVLRVEQKRSQLEHQRIGYQRQQRSIQAQINALLNRPADSSLPPPLRQISPEPLPSLHSSLDEGLQDHPELRRLRSQIAAGDARVELARLESYPDVRLGSGYNSLWSDPDLRWTVGISITIPLDQRRRRAAMDEAQADRLRRQHQLEDEQRQLQSGLVAAHAAVEESLHLIALYRDRLLPLALETRNASLSDYRSGSGEFLNVIDAEQERLQAELGLARAHADYLRHKAELEHRAGGALSAPNVFTGGQADE